MTEKPVDAEVIIVGGGPAGSMCALRLGRLRRQVLLLEGCKMPRPKPCGGWVNVRAFQEFPELEKLRTKQSTRHPAIETPFTGLVFHDPRLEREAVYNVRRTAGYLVQREYFDAALLKMAGACSSVRVEQGARVVGVESGEQGAVVRLADGRTFRGRLLVGADGVDSNVARLTGLRDSWPSSRLVRCLVTELHVDGRTVDRLYGKQRRLHVGLNFGGAAGYGWLFPKKRSISVGIGCRGDEGGDPAVLYRQWSQGLIAAGLAPAALAEARPMSATVPAGGALEYEGHVAKGLLLIGDAGGFVSAATGEGMYPAMLSAVVAAEHLEAALQSSRPQDALLEFKFAWRRRFAEYIQMPNANLAFLLPLIYDNAELCRRLGRCYLFGENF